MYVDPDGEKVKIVSVTGEAGAGIGLYPEFGLGDNEMSFSIDFGFSYKLLDRNPMQIDFAISLSSEEYYRNFGIWTVTKQKLCRDSKGNHYFTGFLEVNCKETNIQLRSEAVYKDGKWVSNNIWKSNKYMELENEQ